MREIRLALAILPIIFLASCSKESYVVLVQSKEKKETELIYISTKSSKDKSHKKDSTLSTLGQVLSGFSKAIEKRPNKVEKRFITGIKGDTDNYIFSFSDYNNDGVLDLFAINPNGYQGVDLYILSGASDYKHFYLQQPLLIEHSSTPVNFCVGNWNSDGVPDLFFFSRLSSGSTLLQVLSGAGDHEHLPYTRLLKQDVLSISDPEGEFFFELSDVNHDQQEDIVIVENSATSMETMHVYVRHGDQFRAPLSYPLTNITKPKSQSITFDDMMFDVLKDLIVVEPTGSDSIKAVVLMANGNYANQMYTERLKLSDRGRILALLSADELPKKGNEEKLEFEFNPYPVFPKPDGIMNFEVYMGRWELIGTRFSSDDNLKTALTITRNTQLSDRASDGIHIDFEDGTRVSLETRSGNVFCTSCERPDEIDIIPGSNLRFYLKEKDILPWSVEKYIADKTIGTILVHNDAHYDANIWASWTEISFGGGHKNITTEKVSLSLADLPILGLNPYHVFSIPMNAENIFVFIDPKDGRDVITKVPISKIDNSCIRIRGDLLSAAFDSDYRYYDWNCDETERTLMAKNGARIANGGFVREVLEHISELIEKNKISEADFLSGDWGVIYEKIFTKKFINDLSKDYPSLASQVSPTAPYFLPNSPADNEHPLLASSNCELDGIERILFTITEERLKPSLAMLAESPAKEKAWLQAVSVGGALGVAFGLDFEAEHGVVFGVNEGKGIRQYTTVTPSWGLTIGLSAALNVGFWSTSPDKMSDGWVGGFSIGAAFYAGIMVSVFWDTDEYMQGSSYSDAVGVVVSIPFGFDFELNPFNFNHTWVHELFPDKDDIREGLTAPTNIPNY